MMLPRRPFLRFALAALAALAPLALGSVPLAAQQAAPSAHAGLPARLSDKEFWQLVSDISEPNGFFRSDNFLSNEAGFQYVIPELVKTTGTGGVYLGVGPEQNFTYIAAMRPRMAVIFDIRRGNVLMHLMYKALFEMSKDRAEFLSRLYSRPRPAGLAASAPVDSLFAAYSLVAPDSALYARNREAMKKHLLARGFALSEDDLRGLDYVADAMYYGGPTLDYNFVPPGNAAGVGMGGFGRMGGGRRPTYADLMVQTDGQGVQRSYLATDSLWRIIKDMHARNLIVPVVGNFAGPKAIRAVGEYLKARNARVSAFYTSNVEQYLFQQGDDWNKYYENVATLPLDSTSTFIRSVGGRNVAPSGASSSPPQPVQFGRLQSVLSSMQGLLAAYKEGRITGYWDVIQMSR